MENVRVVTAAAEMNRVLVTNSTTNASAIANPADSEHAPTLGVIPMGQGGQTASNGLQFLPYGAGVATNTFLMSVFAWDLIHAYDDGNVPYWTAWPLATFTCTLCTLTGKAGSDVNASQLYCGTIALVIGNANISNEIISPTGNMKASITMDAKGCQLVQVLFDRNDSATSANALWRRI